MTLDWQDIVALVAVAAAAVYLAARAWMAVMRKRAGCGACATCPAENAGEKPLVSLEPLPRRSDFQSDLKWTD
jgi:hypothetical protein